MKRKMCKRKATSLIILLMLLVTGIASIGLVYAMKPVSVSGVFTTLDVVYTSMVMRNGNTFLTYIATYDFDGVIDGITTVEGTMVIHANGMGNFHGHGTAIEGTFAGVTGSMESHSHGKMDIIDGTFKGKSVLTSSSGDLENLHLVVYLEGTLGLGGTYTAVYHFDP
jgi:hypothetical protein